MASVRCRRTEGWRRWYYVARAETWAPLTGSCIRPKQNVGAVQSISAFLRQWQCRAASWLSPDPCLLRCTATLRYCRQCRPAIDGGRSRSPECGTSASCEWGIASERKACLGMSCPDQANWRTFSPEGARCEVTEAETTAWDIMQWTVRCRDNNGPVILTRSKGQMGRSVENVRRWTVRQTSIPLSIAGVLQVGPACKLVLTPRRRQ